MQFEGTATREEMAAVDAERRLGTRWPRLGRIVDCQAVSGDDGVMEMLVKFENGQLLTLREESHDADDRV
jgi:hypothetical protein